MSVKIKIPLHFQILIGLVAGTLWAVLSAFMGWSNFTSDWIAPWGDIFIRLLKLVAIPLVLFSIIQGITSLSDTNSLGRLGAKTISIYMLTTMTAISVGLVLVNVLQPGSGISQKQKITNRISYELWVQNTSGVEKLDNLDYLNDPKYKDYVSEANQILNDQENNNEVNQKVQVKKQKENSSPLAFLVDIIPSNIFGAFNDSSMLQIIFFYQIL